MLVGKNVRKLLAAGFANIGIVIVAEAADDLLLLRLKAGELNQETAEFIGRYGKRQPVTTDTSRSLLELTQSICGGAPQMFIYALRAANETPSLDYSKQIAPQETIQFPPCPPRAETSLYARKVQPGDTAWAYYTDSDIPGLVFSPPKAGKSIFNDGSQELVAAFPIPAKYDFDVVDGMKKVGLDAEVAYRDVGIQPVETGIVVDTLQNPTYVDLFTAANPKLNDPNLIQEGSVVLVPDAAEREYALPLEADSAVLLAALSPQEASRQLNRPVAAVAVSSDFDLFNRVSGVSCAPTANDESQAERLHEIMRENISSASAPSLPDPQIVVVDSGVYKPAKLPGTPTVVRPINTSQATFMLRGTNVEDEVKPFRQMPNSMHGTNVSAIALGGSRLGAAAAIDGYRFRLQAFRAFKQETHLAQRSDGTIVVTGGSSEVVTYTLDRDSILDAIRYSADSIVNLSLGRNSVINEIRDKLDPLSRTLFVVAAGNHGVSLDTLPLFPGRHGGSAAPNLITVASVDSDGSLSGFSNWSTDFIELAAPGCLISTLSFNVDDDVFFEEQVSGTSFSAPQVTWIAAAIRKVRPDYSGAHLKIRLLAGSDIVPELAAKIAEGRVLNPVKALSLSRDVVDTGKGAGRELVRGKVKAGSALENYCQQVPSLNGATVVKIIPRFDGAGTAEGVTRIHYVDPGGLVNETKCQSREFVAEVELPDGTIRSVAGGDINDITFFW